MKKINKTTNKSKQNNTLLLLAIFTITTSLFSVLFKLYNPISRANNTYTYIGHITHFILNPLIAFPNTFSKNNLNKDNNFNYIEFELLQFKWK